MACFIDAEFSKKEFIFLFYFTYLILLIISSNLSNHLTIHHV